MTTRRNAKEDSKNIKALINKGHTTDEIMEQMSIKYSQIYYALNYWNSPTVSKRFLTKLKVNNTNKIEEQQKDKKVIEEKNEATTVKQSNKKALLLDTSIVNVKGILDKIEKSKNVTFIFPTRVIEYLESIKMKTGFVGFNARELLNIAIQDNSKIIPTPEISPLIGWSVNDKDNLIVQVALDLADKYDITIYTCDKMLTLKAKSMNIKYDYHKLGAPTTYNEQLAYNANASTNDHFPKQNNLFLLREIKEFDQARTIEFLKHKGFYYLQNKNNFPCYCVIEDNKPVDFSGKLYLEENNTFYVIYHNKISKYIIKNFSNSRNVTLVKIGVFSTELTSVTPALAIRIIRELNY